MSRAPSTLTTWASLVWDALKAQGHDPKPLFEGAGLDPALMRDPEARYPMAGLQQLWLAATAVTGDETLGLTVARRIRPTTFHALGYAWLASHTLGEALARAERYFAVVNDGVRLALGAPRGGEVTLSLTPIAARPPMLAPASVDASAAALVMLARMSAGPEWHPKAVRLPRPKPKAPARFTAFFQTPIDYDARAIALVFDADGLADPLPSGNRELAIANDAVLKRLMARLKQGDIEGQVRSALIERLASGAVHQAGIAKALALSERSLQRKLAEAGTSYQKVLDATRRELGEAYVREGSRSITEIAYLLGFADPANFTRAFRRWLGVAPRALGARGKARQDKRLAGKDRSR
jgi:AraC-like DNA-binding protein